VKKPNFFVVGTVKGGTTSLHQYLSQHPQLFMSPIKETNFFSRFDINENNFSRDYAHDINIDLKHYLLSDMKEPIHIAHINNESDYLKLFKNATNQLAIGEISNSYLLYEKAPVEIFKFDPKAKIIMMLRNPIKRAFSQFVMNQRLGKTLKNNFLEEILEDDNKKIRGWGANHQYLFVGNYYEQVKRYYEIFPKEQIKILFYDDYQKNPNETIKEVYAFLGINTDFVPDFSKKLNEAGVPKFKKLNYFINQFGIISWAKRKFPRKLREPFKKLMYSSNEKDIPTITMEEIEWLNNYYREDISKLGKLINKDLSYWLKE
jgi:hypothetical protein